MTTQAPRWQDRAACRGLPTEAFLGTSARATADALRVCARCPVRASCAVEGERNTHGIWGGVLIAPAYGTRPMPAPLQPAAVRAYRSQATPDTTTDRKENPMPTTRKPAVKATPSATPKATAPAEGRQSEVSKDGTHKCPSCKQTLPVTKFPTARTSEGNYERDLASCRKCREARRAEKKAAKTTAA